MGQREEGRPDVTSAGRDGCGGSVGRGVHLRLMSDARKIILWTAFEPSGDDLAASVIEHLRKSRPDWRHVALAGPRTEQAGAEMLEVSTLRPVMGVQAVLEVGRHLARLRRLRAWLTDQKVDMLVPVDSPGANGSVCGLVRKVQPSCRIAHLVAPQYWAWAPWRINKLKKRSDHVMCLLPFEAAWFGERGMPATFVGHPATAAGYWPEPDEAVMGRLPSGKVKLAILPGSRRSEIEKNGPVMFQAFARLRSRHPQISAAVAAFNAEQADRLHTLGRQVLGAAMKQYGLVIESGQTAQVLRWCDMAMVTSGTATLHTACHHKPMVVVYRMNPIAWYLVGIWLIRTRRFALPNLIDPDQPPLVPELVPFFGQVRDLVDAADPLIRSKEERERVGAMLAERCRQMQGDRFTESVERVMSGLLEEAAEGEIDGEGGGVIGRQAIEG